MAESYKTQNIIMAVGDDFTYQFAKETFEFVERFA